jgi:hypothetical protein
MADPDSSSDGSGALLYGSTNRGRPMQIQFCHGLLVAMQHRPVGETFSVF